MATSISPTLAHSYNDDDDDDGVLQGSLGGGVIQTTASESTFVCLLAGRTEAIKRYQVQM